MKYARRVSILVAFSLALGVASEVVAQDSLLDGSQPVLAKSKKKKKKRRKKKKVEKKKEEAKEEEATNEAPEDDEDNGATQSATLQRGNRMEFDGRLIRGETAGSGAVFLFQRAPRPLPSMVIKRDSYLGGTVRTVFGGKGLEQFESSKVKKKTEIEKTGESKKRKKAKSK